MPIATFCFNLPEEQEEFETMSNAQKYKSALFRFSEYIRRVVKYPDKDYSMIDIRKEFYEILSAERVELD